MATLNSINNAQTPTILTRRAPYLQATFFIAIGIISALGSILLLLTAKGIVPFGINANTTFNFWGQVTGYGLAGIGCLTFIIAAVKSCRNKRDASQQNNSPSLFSRLFYSEEENLSRFLDDWVASKGGRLASKETSYRIKDAVRPYSASGHKCKYLFLSKIESEFPNIFNYLSDLETLTINDSSLPGFPECICKAKRLTKLNLTSCDLWNIPDSIGNLEQLSSLELAINRLSTLPSSIGKLRNLYILNLNGNSFQTLPTSIQNLTNLQFLSIRSNQLVDLPDWLFEMPNIVSIRAENNRFSENTVLSIQERLDAINHRTGKRIVCQVSVYQPTNSSVENDVESLVNFWKKEFNTLTKSILPSLDLEVLRNHEFCGHLETFLQKAKNCEDFKKPKLKTNMILEIHEMLIAMIANKEFRDLAFTLIKDGSGACGDRVATFLDYIRIQRILSQSNDLDDLKLASLLIGLKRLAKVDALAYEKAELCNVVDALEVILGYHIGLRERLALPLITQAMLYPKLANLEKDELVAAEKKVLDETKDFAAILIEIDSWNKRMIAQNQDAFDAIDQAHKLPDDSEFKQEGLYKEAVDTIKAKRELAIQQKIIECTQKWLSVHQAQLFNQK